MAPDLEAAFEKIARRYDILNHLLSFNMDRGWRKRLVDETPLPEGSRVLDLCTGTGDLALEFCKRDEVAEVTGVDFSQKMLDLAREKTLRQGCTCKLCFARADIFDPALPVGMYDVVSIGFGLRNLEDTGEGLERMRQFLKPGGHAAILELSPVRNRTFSTAHSLYTSTVLPAAGWMLSGAREEYRYLATSIRGYLYPDQILQRMAEAGFSKPRHVPLGKGIANIYIGSR